jgi:hypothetical protein
LVDRILVKDLRISSDMKVDTITSEETHTFPINLNVEPINNSLSEQRNSFKFLLGNFPSNSGKGIVSDSVRLAQAQRASESISASFVSKIPARFLIKGSI